MYTYFNYFICVYAHRRIKSINEEHPTRLDQLYVVSKTKSSKIFLYLTKSGDFDITCWNSANDNEPSLSRSASIMIWIEQNNKILSMPKYFKIYLKIKNIKLQSFIWLHYIKFRLDIDILKRWTITYSIDQDFHLFLFELLRLGQTIYNLRQITCWQGIITIEIWIVSTKIWNFVRNLLIPNSYSTCFGW